MSGMVTSVLSLILVALAGSQTPTPAAPQGSTLPNAQVAFVSSQRISSQSAAGRAAALRLQLLQQEKAADVRQRQQALEAVRAKLAGADQSSLMPLLVQEQAVRTELERAVQQAQADLQKLQREITADIQIRVRAALDEILKGAAVQIVLQSENAIVWGVPSLDLTTLVIEKMDARSGEKQ
jgi:Skp family chaperone for outer membrane proteins